MIPDILTETSRWFQEAVPSPNSKNLHTQLGVHFEEVSEMIVELQTEDGDTQMLLDGAFSAIQDLANHLKTHDAVITINRESRLGFLDALCDQIVTAVGCAHVTDTDILNGMAEVNRSNFSKFVNGHPLFNENMKVMKGPNYTKPDLSPFI